MLDIGLNDYLRGPVVRCGYCIAVVVVKPGQIESAIFAVSFRDIFNPTFQNSSICIGRVEIDADAWVSRYSLFVCLKADITGCWLGQRKGPKASLGIDWAANFFAVVEELECA